MDDKTTAVRRTGVLDFVKTIGNKEYHVLSPVIGGVAIKTDDDHSIIIPISHFDEFAEWLNNLRERLHSELDKAHKFERGE